MVRIKIFIVLIFIFSFSYANAEEKRPIWVDKPPSDKESVYFSGVSDYFLDSESNAGEKSRKAGCTRARDELAAYLGIRVSSEQEIIQTMVGDSVNTTATIKHYGVNDHLISGIKTYKTYKEVSKDGTNFRTWCLIKLNKNTENKLRAEMLKDMGEYEKAFNKLLMAIDQQDYENAKTLLSVARGYRASKLDDRIENVERWLSDILKNILSVTLQLDKKVYKPGERISLIFSVTKKSFVYVFYDNGKNYELVFPNKVMSSNILDMVKVVKAPNQNMIDDEIYITAYEDLGRKKGSFLAVASLENLFIEKYSVGDGGDFMVFERNGKWRDEIDKCSVKRKCVSIRTNFTLTSESRTTIPVELVVQSEDDAIAKMAEIIIKNILKSNRFHVDPNQAEYRMEIRVSRERIKSSILDMVITVLSLKGALVDKDTGDIVMEFSKNKQTPSDDLSLLKGKIQDLMNSMMDSVNKTLGRSNNK